MEQMVAPTRELDGVMGALGRSAGTAAGALLAFASVDNIVRGLEQLSSKFRDLNGTLHPSQLRPRCGHPRP